MINRQIDYRIEIAAAVLGFFLLVVLYATEIPFFNRYLSFSKFMIFSLTFGLILGGAGAWYFSKKLTDSYDRMRLRIGLLVAGLIFGPLLFSLINRHLDPWPSRIETVEFFDLEERYSSRFGLPETGKTPEPNSIHLYFYRNSSLTRIVFNKKIDLTGVDRGDLIGIIIRQGLFGVEWVKAVRSKTVDSI